MNTPFGLEEAAIWGEEPRVATIFRFDYGVYYLGIDQYELIVPRKEDPVYSSFADAHEAATAQEVDFIVFKFHNKED